MKQLVQSKHAFKHVNMITNVRPLLQQQYKPWELSRKAELDRKKIKLSYKKIEEAKK